MSGTAIVALPSVDEDVYDVSSEKVPHLTMMYLGEVEDMDVPDIVTFVQHAATHLSPFFLTVDYRDTLGDSEADVLFFEDNIWEMPEIKRFRHQLLLNDAIKRAHDREDQFPDWKPHLTLGYPDAPAKDDEDKHLRMVRFDRLAVWFGDYEGPEIRLKYNDNSSATEVSMSDTMTVNRGAQAVDELFHYGVKGMRWGVRKDEQASRGGASQGPTKQVINEQHRQLNTGYHMRSAKPPTDVVVTQKNPGKFAKSSGGKNLPMSDDARAALEARQKAKASTTDALSNRELQAAVTRMNLEQQYANLSFQSDRRSKGARFVAGLLGQKRYTDEKRRYKDFSEEMGYTLNQLADQKLDKSGSAA